MPGRAHQALPGHGSKSWPNLRLRQRVHLHEGGGGLGAARQGPEMRSWALPSSVFITPLNGQPNSNNKNNMHKVQVVGTTLCIVCNSAVYFCSQFQFSACVSSSALSILVWGKPPLIRRENSPEVLRNATYCYYYVGRANAYITKDFLVAVAAHTILVNGPQ